MVMKSVPHHSLGLESQGEGPRQQTSHYQLLNLLNVGEAVGGGEVKW